MVWLGIVPWNNLSHFTKDNQLPKLIPLASLILFSCSRENWECSNILLTLAGHGNISFSFEKCGHVQVFLAAEQTQVSSSILGKKRESVSCGMQNNQGSPSPRCVLWGRCENSLFLGYFGSRSASCSWCPPFYLLSIPSSLSGPEIRRLTNTCDCWKLCMPENVSVFHTFDKKKPLPKPEILQPAQFWHQYLNIQGRMSHFSEVENNPNFRLSKVPNILYLGTYRKLKPESSLNCLEREKKKNI